LRFGWTIGKIKYGFNIWVKIYKEMFMYENYGDYIWHKCIIILKIYYMKLFLENFGSIRCNVIVIEPNQLDMNSSIN